MGRCVRGVRGSAADVWDCVANCVKGWGSVTAFEPENRRLKVRRGGALRTVAEYEVAVRERDDGTAEIDVVAVAWNGAHLVASEDHEDIASGCANELVRAFRRRVAVADVEREVKSRKRERGGAAPTK